MTGRDSAWPRPGGSRARTDALLGGLRSGGWRPGAWARFLGAAACWSWQDARARPRAVSEATLLHAVFLAARPRSRRWVVVSWAMTVSHLGLLEERRSLGLPGLLTLTRANLPALGAGRALGVAAIALDLLDGRSARRRGQVTRFGAYADSLADAAFWTWFAATHEPSRRARAAALVAWAAPVAVVTVISVARGRMIDVPRPRSLRPAAAYQAILAIRALRSLRSPVLARTDMRGAEKEDVHSGRHSTPCDPKGSVGLYGRSGRGDGKRW